MTTNLLVTKAVFEECKKIFLNLLYTESVECLGKCTKYPVLHFSEFITSLTGSVIKEKLCGHGYELINIALTLQQEGLIEFYDDCSAARCKITIDGINKLREFYHLVKEEI